MKKTHPEKNYFPPNTTQKTPKPKPTKKNQTKNQPPQNLWKILNCKHVE